MSKGNPRERVYNSSINFDFCHLDSNQTNNNTDISELLSSDSSFWIIWVWIFPIMYLVMIILECYARMSSGGLCLKNFFGPRVLTMDFLRGPKLETNDSNNDHQEDDVETEGNPMIVIANTAEDQPSIENCD